MPRCAVLFILVSSFFGNAFAKCGPPDSRKIISTRKILERSVPRGVEIFDRVWVVNPTATELVIFTPEKGAAARTGYRETLGAVPTTKDELPATKLVNGERYEYHFPTNPDYSGGKVTQGGWVRQDYPAGLIESKAPVVTPALESRIFSGKTKVLTVKSSVPYYFGKKRGSFELVYEFRRNPEYLKVDPSCPSPAASPSAVP